MLLERSIALYLVSKAERTKIDYRQIFYSWFLHVETRKADVTAPTEIDATTYIDSLRLLPGRPVYGPATPFAVKTVCKHVAVLRKLYSIAIERGEARSNPFRAIHIRKPRSPEKRRCEEFPPHLVRCLFRSRVSTKHRALFAALFGGGLRIGEAVGLNVGDVVRRGDCVYLYLRHTKSGEPQEQPLPRWASRHVIRFLRSRKGTEHQPLFTAKNGGRMTKRMATIIFVREGSLVGAQNLYPHSARRAAISQLLRGGVSLRDVQIFSRHASIDTVCDYDKRRLHREHHPGHLLKF